jgi:hypothetical protein
MNELLAPQPSALASEGLGWDLGSQFAYYMALLFAKDRAMAMEALHEIAKKLSADFIAAIEALEKSSGLERPGPLARLQWYREKPDELWSEQEAKFPRRFDRDQQDYEKLQDRALDGDFGPQERAIEMALIVSEVEEMMA